jgi:hypothetical protein
MFIRRSGPISTRFTVARVTIFFLAAGLWVAGVLAGDERITAAAIAVGVFGLFLGFIARRSVEPALDEDLEEEDPASRGR